MSGGFEHDEIRDTSWAAAAGPGEEFEPDVRAAANAIKEQGRAGSHEALNRAHSFIVFTATREKLASDADFPDRDPEAFSHSMEIFGSLDATVRENVELLHIAFSYMVEKTAQSLGIPEIDALTLMTKRWAVEYIEDDERL